MKSAFGELKETPSFVFKNKRSLRFLLQQAVQYGLVARKKRINDLNLFGLHEMAIYGIKGGVAYLYHAEGVRSACEDP